jgi:IclR family pca regulon transcriptional regulator
VQRLKQAGQIVTEGTPGGDDFVQSLSRGLSVIRAFDEDHQRLTQSEVARRAQVSPAAARRFLHTLESLGYVRSDNRHFTLTPRVLELGFSYLASLSIPSVIQPHLEQLSAQVNESASAAVLDSTDIVYVARAATQRIMSVNISLGTRFPAYATSMGRVLLAWLEPDAIRSALAHSKLEARTSKTLTNPVELLVALDKVRADGWASVDGELEEGLFSIAAPVRNADGAVVAALNISMSASTLKPERVRDELLPELLATAAAVSADLRFRLN